MCKGVHNSTFSIWSIVTIYPQIFCWAMGQVVSVELLQGCHMTSEGRLPTCCCMVQNNNLLMIQLQSFVHNVCARKECLDCFSTLGLYSVLLCLMHFALWLMWETLQITNMTFPVSLVMLCLILSILWLVWCFIVPDEISFYSLGVWFLLKNCPVNCSAVLQITILDSRCRVLYIMSGDMMFVMDEVAQ